MQHQKLILFDFDGVIIDGINEYWYSSLLACKKYLFPDHKQLDITNTDVSPIFIEMRPWVKFGWEMVLITHEIIKTNDPLTNINKDKFLENYEDNCSKLLKKNAWDSQTLQKYLDDARKTQINNDLKKWISLHNPYDEVIEFIRQASNIGYKIGVISTKGKIFTSKILNNINLYPELIFGYEAGKKVDIIIDLSQKYNIKAFVEDRIKTLIDVQENKQTDFIKCFLAEWGYLKKTDIQNLPKRIKLLKIKNLEDILAN